MSGMKRFVTYIYSYEENRKGRNVGFAKLELRGDVFRLEIHLRGLLLSHTVCKVCLIHIEGGMITGFPIGRIEIQNGTCDCSLGMSALKIAGSDYSIRDMDGLMLSDEENRFFMSRWREGEALIVDSAHFNEWSGAVTPRIPDAAELPDAAEFPDPAEIPDTAATSDAAVLPDVAKVSSAPDATAPPDTLSATELPMRNFFPRYRLADVWETLLKERTVCTPFAEKRIECLKIELKELRELPRCFWYLGNNSFLLHGFFNYRHLILAKCPDGRWFLGIPGIYQNQEHVMAVIFGFPEFLPEGTSDAPEATEPVNHFGYWYPDRG